METDVREPMIVKGGVNGMESPKTVLLEASEEEEVEEEEDSESYSLLNTEKRRGGMARSGERRRLSVQWSDANGNKLAEILEFQPSEVSDSDEDESDACFCCIM